mmetsp:Transcript_7853/g.31046  ORF Transcript_7853/g.31046 Transcript_7853/m.31046 type:complete len:227 (+) Transcript_7853:145-825(+)
MPWARQPSASTRRGSRTVCLLAWPLQLRPSRPPRQWPARACRAHVSGQRQRRKELLRQPGQQTLRRGPPPAQVAHHCMTRPLRGQRLTRLRPRRSRRRCRRRRSLLPPRVPRRPRHESAAGTSPVTPQPRWPRAGGATRRRRTAGGTTSLQPGAGPGQRKPAVAHGRNTRAMSRTPPARGARQPRQRPTSPAPLPVNQRPLRCQSPSPSRSRPAPSQRRCLRQLSR